MDRARDRGRWMADGWRRIGATPYPLGLLGALLGLAALIETIVRASGTGAAGLFVLVLCALAVASTLPMGLLPPRTAAVVVCGAGLLSLWPFHSLTVAGLCGQLIVLYRLARSGPQWSVAVVTLPYPMLAVVEAAQSDVRLLTVLAAGTAPASAWAGVARQARAAISAHAAAREVIVGSLLEHTARGERARIARELHDVVAHHVSMIAVQAETARLTTAGMPAGGARQLSAIGDTARTALTEMRRLLGVLREDGVAATGGDTDRHPQPGLGQLNDLLDQARLASGAGARLIVAGPPDPLDPGVELAAYRIVQEALTNARRHAPGSAVDVELHYADDTVRLRIRDNGPGPDADAPLGGLGLLGMRERAIAVGGELTTGAAVGGGFLVETILPVKPEPTG